jgi:hypothetical protein
MGNANAVPTSSSDDRFDAARDDFHDPTAGLGGAPPARSALILRLILALFGAVVCAAGAVLFVTVADAPGLTAVLVVCALIGVVDAVVVVRRKQRGEPG